MFKDEYKRMNESIKPGSELLKRTERSMAEIMNKKDAKRMSAKMAKGFYVLFSPCREKSTKRAPLGERPLRSFPKSPIYAVSTARTQGPRIVREG